MKKIVLAVLLPVLMLLLSGCEAGSYILEKVNHAVDSITDPQLGGDTRFEAVTDRIVRISVSGLDTFQPLATRSQSAAEVMGVVYEPLYTLSDNGQAQPVLAESSALLTDTNALCVQLKQGVKWHDGSAFTAADVVYSVKQITNPDCLWYTPSITGAYVQDGNAVIQLNGTVPNPQTLLTFPIIQDQTEAAPDKSYVPLGTGAFRYQGRDSVSSYLFEIFDGYHGERPEFDAVKIYETADHTQARQLFQIGETDVLTAAQTDIQSFTTKNNMKLIEHPTNRMTYLGINFRNRLFWGASTRQALSYVIDKQKLVSSVLYRKGAAVDVPMNPESWLYTAPDKTPGRDLDTGEQLMMKDRWQRGEDDIFFRETAGERELFSVSLLVDAENADQLKTAYQVAQELTTFGISCTVQEEEKSAYNDLILSQNYDIFIGEANFGNNFDYGVITPPEGNAFTFVSEKADRLMMQMGTETDAEAMKRLYQEYCREIFRETPYVPLYFKNGGAVYRSKIKSGVSMGQSMALYDLHTWKLE